ncbi:MAG: hypothetical protein LBH07_03735, partial [Treponema sp.]|nr:hypothetical protein [Treponema sp.]
MKPKTIKTVVAKPVFILILSIIFSACFSNWPGDTEGSVTINFGGGTGRAAMPWPDDEEDLLGKIEYVVTMTGSGSPITFTTKGNETIRRTVPAGSYTIKVDAYLSGAETPLSPNGERFHYATAASSVNVKPGQASMVSITMGGINFCKECDFDTEEPTFIAAGLVTWDCDEPSHVGTHVLPQRAIMSDADWNTAIGQAAGGAHTLILGESVSSGPRTLSANTNLTLT